MLTTALLRYSRNGAHLTPGFLSPDSAAHAKLAEALIACYRDGVGKSRAELAEKTALICAESRSQKIGRGLDHLIATRYAAWSESDPQAAWKKREAIFLATARARKALSENLSLADYKRALATQVEAIDPAWLADYFPDLEDRARLLSLSPLSPEGLVHHYNIALVQGLLLRAKSLAIVAVEPRPAASRAFLRALKFFRLLADLRLEGENRFRLAVDGPLNILTDTTRYGLNLAQFFPALLHLSHWELTAEVRLLPRGRATLQLDTRCGIRPMRPAFSAYIPDPIVHFSRELPKALPDWKVRESGAWLSLGAQALCVPDLVLEPPQGQSIFVELFHRHHARALLARLPALETCKDPLRFVIGVDRRLLKIRGVKSALARSRSFEERGFLFSEFPSAKVVATHLKSRF